MGCYADSTPRDFSTEFSISPLSIESCINTCLSQNYLYAGLQNR